jgi:hypothetical protein
MQMNLNSDWAREVGDLEFKARSNLGKMEALRLKKEAEEALAMAELEHANAEVQDRLDLLILDLTEKARESACTNQNCPHRGDKCRMR